MPPPIKRRPPTHFGRPVEQPNCRVIPNRSPIRHVAHPVVRRPRIILRQRQRHDRPEFVDGPQWMAQSRHGINITLLHNSVKCRLANSSVLARGLGQKRLLFPPRFLCPTRSAKLGSLSPTARALSLAAAGGSATALLVTAGDSCSDV